jgi:hypothetical protein
MIELQEASDDPTLGDRLGIYVAASSCSRIFA